MTVKNWRLTVNYMGATTTEVVPEPELADVWTFVEIGAEIDKCDGGQFEDEVGPKESPLEWEGGRATETRCGPWKNGMDDYTVAFCDRLLARAGLPGLVRGVTLEETFDMEGVNAEELDALDRAEWTLTALPDVPDLDDEWLRAVAGSPRDRRPERTGQDAFWGRSCGPRVSRTPASRRSPS